MSVPYLMASMHSHQPASARIPPMARPFVSQKALKMLDLVEQFVEGECIPADEVWAQQVNANGRDPKARFSAHSQVIEDLKVKAKKLGLWNMFLPKNHFEEISPGFTNMEYGLMAEILGRSVTASEVFSTGNCSAPDTGNMEVIAKYGTEVQKKQWLAPLLKGEIRSAFLMTEPKVASSDATNIELSMRKDGNDWVLNGEKWWSSGAGDPRCKIFLVMGKSDPKNPNKHKQQSVVLVPAETTGVTIYRMLSVMGFDHAPHGHGHIVFKDVRVPQRNIILGEGHGFQVIQGRLGPGRIHHAMRSVGAAEKALDYFLARLNDPAKKTFGKQLYEHDIMLERVARSRIEIDSARLAVLNAAIKIDQFGPKKALKEIAEVKVQVPAVLLDVLDRAIQAYGVAGVSQDTPLASMYSSGRTMRIVDGPDEVHLLQLGKNENKRGSDIRKRINAQKEKTGQLLAHYGLAREDILLLNREPGKSKL